MGWRAVRGKRSAGVIEIPQAKLWDAEHPNLYTCVVKTESDEESVPFGIRTLTWSAKTGLCVNGKAVKLRGGASTTTMAFWRLRLCRCRGTPHPHYEKGGL